VVRGDRPLVDMTTVSRVSNDSNKVVVLAGQGQDCGRAGRLKAARSVAGSGRIKVSLDKSIC